MEDRSNIPGTVEHFICQTIATLQGMMADFPNKDIDALTRMEIRNLKSRYETYKAIFLDGDTWVKDKDKKKKNKELIGLVKIELEKLRGMVE